MANALNKELHVGDVVVAKRKYVKDSVKDLRMVINCDSFGLSPHTMGSAIYVTWMEDQSEDRWEGDMLDPKASEKAQEEIVKDPIYGWLFKIIKTLQSSLEYQRKNSRQLQEKVNSLTEELKKRSRTRVVSVHANALSVDNKHEVRVTRTDGSIRVYHITKELNSWLYGALFSDVESKLWDNKKQPGIVRLYP